MITVVYRPSFIRHYKKLPIALQEEVKEKIALFREDPAHSSLKVHKLKGKLQGGYSFSVNYRYRIVFEFESKSTAALLMIGDHSVYA